MMIAIQRSRAISIALFMAVVLLAGVGIFSSTLPKAHADGVRVTSSAVVWANYPCIAFSESGVNYGSVIRAQREVQRENRALSPQDAWNVTAIGVVTSCPEGMGVLAQYVPHLTPYFGPWMFATKDSNGLTAAYWDRGKICGILAAQGGEAAVNSMYGTFASYPLTPNDAKKAAIAGTIAFCPWNLGALRAYYGG